ncbi:MAG: saccharopine dehydrogenase NADP-binding domain-containing protein [Deltaproteobacteria bacterium]|nr:saccharopine dehydrogenase NADP-binding domain-containing protein [Deltaproteobacteria bacterium]MBW2071485.1 saccharopine dehydrogenase NADP-binding domain-containing protein [Deltaproteobacteria bacterium]
MKYLVLGAGLQGRAVIYGLFQLDPEADILVADLSTEAARRFVERVEIPSPEFIRLDAADSAKVSEWMSRADVIIDMLPITFNESMARLAISAGRHLVNTFYAGEIVKLHRTAVENGVTILPEMGMDPGIDLVMARRMLSSFDQIREFYSYGAGIPERDACNNILNYKISWTWEGVLTSYVRPARLLKGGREVLLAGAEVFAAENLHTVEHPELGALDAIPNGDALSYIDLLGLSADRLEEMGRYSLRWPGHAAIIRTWHQLGFFEEAPAPSLGVSPFMFLVKHFEPRLQYEEDERDLGIVSIRAVGTKDGQDLAITDTLIDRRDLATGLFAMNRMVGFSAAIAAQMIASQTIDKRGVLSPARDVPVEPFLEGLSRFGMEIVRKVGTSIKL